MDINFWAIEKKVDAFHTTAEHSRAEKSKHVKTAAARNQAFVLMVISVAKKVSEKVKAG